MGGTRVGACARSIRGAVALVLVGTVPAAVTAQQSANAAKSLVFEGVTVVDVEHGELLTAQRVVIAGNHIQAMGSSRAVRVPKGAQVVEAKGKYLIPGLWDMHTHPRTLAHLFYPLFIANGVTGIRDAWSEVPLDTLIQWRQEILAGTRVGPPLQLLNGYRAVNEIGGGIIGAGFIKSLDDLVDSLRERKAHGANFLKLYPYTPEAAAAARRSGLPFGGHIHGDISAMDASDSGMSIIDHINTSGGLDTLCWAEEATVEKCQPLAERFRKNGTWFVPTLVRLHNHSIVTASRSKAVFDRFAERASKFWKDSAWSPVADAAKEVSSPAPASVPASDSLGAMAVMQRVGLPILAGTDAGAPVIREVPPGFALHAELEMYVAEGLTPLAALQAATLNPAKLIHGTDSLGTVAPGKLADLVLLDDNPLANIINTATIRAVVANGRYFDRAALDKLLAEVRTKMP